MDQPKPVVVGVDLPQPSSAAIRQGARTAQFSQARLYVVHTVDPAAVRSAARADGGSLEEAGRRLVEDARKTIQGVTAAIPEAEGCELVVQTGEEPAALLSVAREKGADLIVIGFHGASDRTKGIGALARACLRKAGAGVLLVRESHMEPFRSVLACVDFSEVSAHALKQAARVADQTNSVLHVIHVFFGPWNVLHYRAPTPEANPEFKARYYRELQARLEGFVEAALGKDHRGQVKCELLDSNYRCLEIGEYGKKMGADLIAVGTHHRGRLHRLLKGSTAESLAKETTSSILMVRAG
jgi:universal stress protein E